MEIVARATFTVFFLLLITRGLKKRSLADMAPFEMLLLVTLGDIVQQGVTQEDYSVTGAVLAVSTFAFWVTVLTYASWRWRPVARIVEVASRTSLRYAMRASRHRAGGPTGRTGSGRRAHAPGGGPRSSAPARDRRPRRGAGGRPRAERPHLVHHPIAQRGGDRVTA